MLLLIDMDTYLQHRSNIDDQPVRSEHQETPHEYIPPEVRSTALVFQTAPTQHPKPRGTCPESGPNMAGGCAFDVGTSHKSDNRPPSAA